MVEAEICLYGVDYAQIVDRLLGDISINGEDPVWILSKSIEQIKGRAEYWCTYHNVSMTIHSVKIDYAELDGDRADNSLSVVVRADGIVPSEIASALGIGGTLLKISQLIPDDFSLGVISGIINMNRRLISSEGVKLLRKKGIKAESISVRMLRDAEAVLK